MKAFALVAALSLGLAGCVTATPGTVLSAIPVSPSALADRTAIDEQVGIGFTLAYTAAAKAAALLIRTGLIKDPATIRTIGDLDNRCFAAVTAIRGAYLAGNAASYRDALAKGNAALRALLASLNKGNKP